MAQVQPGQSAKIILKSYITTPLEGTVIRIGPQSNGTIGDAATFMVEIEIDANELDLRPGMTGRVEITNEE